MPAEERERCLSLLLLLQTLSQRRGQAAAGPPVVTQPLASPSTRPVWMERCQNRSKSHQEKMRHE